MRIFATQKENLKLAYNHATFFAPQKKVHDSHLENAIFLQRKKRTNAPEEKYNFLPHKKEYPFQQCNRIRNLPQYKQNQSTWRNFKLPNFTYPW